MQANVTLPPSSTRRWVPSTQRLVVTVVTVLILGPVAFYAGRREVANWHLAAAQQHLYAGELAQALESNDHAQAWDAASERAWRQATEIHLARGDAKSAIPLVERTLKSARSDFELHPTTANLSNLINALNTCAYTHALDHSDLNRALGLIDEAFELAGTLDSPNERDTRGYLHLLLGNHELALTDLEAAVSGFERDYKSLLHANREQGRMFVDKTTFEFQAQQLTGAMAVLYQHRGLAYRAVGNEEAAEEDSRRASEMGYDPKKGVW